MLIISQLTRVATSVQLTVTTRCKHWNDSVRIRSGAVSLSLDM